MRETAPLAAGASSAVIASSATHAPSIGSTPSIASIASTSSAPSTNVSASGSASGGSSAALTPVKSPDRLRFAVIGDYGVAGDAERRVAELVKAYHPEIVITTGDNNYPLGGADTIDRNIGQYYSEFIGGYHGKYGPGASENRFFPALGNHDWYTDEGKAYFDYFTLPGNERYYSFRRGPVEFFAIDSDPHEPDGMSATSKQASWLKAGAQASRAAWQIAYMHHPPYSSGPHGSTTEAQWPYAEWGVDLVLAGHDHTYERAKVRGFTYLVNGLGGNDEYGFKTPAPGSEFRYNEKHGAQLAEASLDELRLTFVNVDGTRIDEVVLTHDH
ncbi:MAG TPA: metallophosphoesterase [Polyangiaceae bacterium]|nr:metallophosphoesterase [Polyangiaceae bacterium]